MRNLNVKIFTTFTYLLLLVLIVGSVAFLVVQRVQMANQSEAYTSQIIERIKDSYIASGSFTTAAFTREVKEAMQNFSDLIKVITIVDSQNIMQNRFRFDSTDPDTDQNPGWQNELQYKYNPILYEQQSYPLNLPGQVSATINVIYQRLPSQLIKDVLQFNTVVILALLILSFLTFLVIPKRDPADTAWALESVAEEEVINPKELLANTQSASVPWASQDLPENSWGEYGSPEQDKQPNGDDDEDDEFDQVLGSDKFDGNVAPIEAEDNAADSWGDSWGPRDEEVDLSFNDQIAEEQEASDNISDNIDEDEAELDLNEEPIDVPESFTITNRPPSVDDIESAADESDLDTSLDSADKSNEPEPDDQKEDEDDFVVALNNKSYTPKASTPLDSSAELFNMEELSVEEYLGDEVIDDLDEGLGNDDELEKIDEPGLDIFSQLAISEREKTGLLPDATNDDDADSQNQQGETVETEVPSSLSGERKQEVLNMLNNFLEDQQTNNEMDSTPDLSVALLETNEADVDIVRSALEEYLTLKAYILPNDKGMAVFLPCKNIQDGIEELQVAASKLPATYLKNLKMGITGVSTARSSVDSTTVLAEMDYALASCDDANNISIFDANDDAFNQQQK